MADEKIYSEDFKIRASEVSPDGKATLPAICYLLQEVAGNNALELNFDISQLKSQELTWILHRLHLQMDTFPEWRDTITIETWPSGGDKLRAYRDFRILNSAGNEIGRCLSYWLLINLKSRRPVRIPSEILAKVPKSSTHVLDVQKNRLTFEIDNAANTKIFRARKSDLDMNNHVNNGAYVEWTLETLGDQKVNEIDIEFRAECTAGNEIRSSVIHPNQSLNRHQLIRSNDQQTVAVAVSRSLI